MNEEMKGREEQECRLDLWMHSEKPEAGVHPGQLEKVLLTRLWTGSSAAELSSALEG